MKKPPIKEVSESESESDDDDDGEEQKVEKNEGELEVRYGDDGGLYTKDEFYDQYKRYDEWNKALPEGESFVYYYIRVYIFNKYLSLFSLHTHQH